MLAEIVYKQEIDGEKQTALQMRNQFFWDMTMALEDEDTRVLRYH